MAMKACPYRKDFFAKLGSPQDVVLQQMSVWLAALEAIVKQIMAFIEPYSSALYLIRRSFSSDLGSRAHAAFEPTLPRGPVEMGRRALDRQSACSSDIESI